MRLDFLGSEASSVWPLQQRSAADIASAHTSSRSACLILQQAACATLEGFVALISLLPRSVKLVVQRYLLNLIAFLLVPPVKSSSTAELPAQVTTPAVATDVARSAAAVDCGVEAEVSECGSGGGASPQRSSHSEGADQRLLC